MKRICAWCGGDLGMIETALYPDSTVSHGICPGCAQKYFDEPKDSVSSFLVRIPTEPTQPGKFMITPAESLTRPGWKPLKKS
jgi:hypothetical protein